MEFKAFLKVYIVPDNSNFLLLHMLWVLIFEKKTQM